MEIGIVGLPGSGKTTVFNALTKGHAQTGAYSSAASAPNIGVVKVPDPRLNNLTALLKPKRTIAAEVTYVDVAAPARGFGKGEGPGAQFLDSLSKVDAIVHVVRVFEDDRVPHSEGYIDPNRDVVNMNLELTVSDLTIIERRLERLTASLKGARQQEKEQIFREQSLLNKIKSRLEEDVPVREQELSSEEIKEIEGFQFLTAKPLLLLLNIGENQISENDALEDRYRNKYKGDSLDVATLCGQVEMELTELSDSESQEFRASLGLGESGLDRVIQISYGLLGFISFFTVVSDEIRAWTIRRNTTVQKAAGKVHTDMERGFIRAEVIGFDDLISCDSIAEARKRGLLRLEGKNYIVQDGDIVTVLFNV
ncbi:MAG: redox-regulated ATPase YchF [Dehalococcoidia bacterium]|nr:MAG: redox-regulated ATPase YchF [Dehalococcoidia bacterium]